MKTQAWLLGALLATGAGGFGMASAQAPAATPQPAATQSNWFVEGRVIKVDDDDVKISRAGGPNIEFDVTLDTTVKMNGATAKLQDLQPGTEVRVRFELADDETQAQEIEVVRAATPQPKR